MGENTFILTADVGASKTRTALFTVNPMRLVNKKIVMTPEPKEPEDIAKVILKLFEDLLKESGASLNEVVGACVGTIGPLDIRTGDVVRTPNLGFKSFKLKEPLEKVLRIPVYVINDAVAGVYAEYMAGHGLNHNNVVYLTLSSGIGAGAVVDGNLLIGKDGNAHEVGHIVVDYNSKVRCGCGGLGHWEALASGSNVWKLVIELSNDWTSGETPFLSLSRVRPVSMDELLKYWRVGDQFASYVVQKLVKINAAGIASVINVYDPEVLVLGGSIALNNPDFISEVLSKTREYLINRPPEFAITSFKDDVVLYGAAWIVIKTPEQLLKIQKRSFNR